MLKAKIDQFNNNNSKQDDNKKNQKQYEGKTYTVNSTEQTYVNNTSVILSNTKAPQMCQHQMPVKTDKPVKPVKPAKKVKTNDVEQVQEVAISAPVVEPSPYKHIELRKTRCTNCFDPQCPLADHSTEALFEVLEQINSGKNLSVNDVKAVMDLNTDYPSDVVAMSKDDKTAIQIAVELKREDLVAFFNEQRLARLKKLDSLRNAMSIFGFSSSYQEFDIAQAALEKADPYKDKAVVNNSNNNNNNNNNASSSSAIANAVLAPVTPAVTFAAKPNENAANNKLAGKTDPQAVVAPVVPTTTNAVNNNAVVATNTTSVNNNGVAATNKKGFY